MILHRATPLPTMFRRYIAKRASQRFDDIALRQVLHQSELETDEHAMVQATIGLSYAALATPGEAEERIEVLRRQLLGNDDRSAAALGGLLALGQTDVFIRPEVKSLGRRLGLSLTLDFKDYAPVLQLVAERWEELETITGNILTFHLCRWGTDPADFWYAFAPYVSLSSVFSTRFFEYCEDESVLLDARQLEVLSRLRPGSSLLLDCCKRVLAAEFDIQKWGPVGAAETTIVASKCLATQFSEDSTAFAALIAASDSLRGQASVIG